MILGFNVNYEAYIKTQYPKSIAESLNVKPSDLMNVYTLHRMKKNEPNFFQMEIKEFTLASFFTGFSYKRYVGQPDLAITVFLSEDEINQDVLPKDFEGMVRRLAHEILPLRATENDDHIMDELLKDYFIKLQNGELEPYWEEKSEEEVESEKITIDTTEIDAISKQVSSEVEFSEDDESELKAEIVVQPKDKFSKDNLNVIEKQELEKEIKELKTALSEKIEKIRELTKKIADQQSDKSEREEWKTKYEDLIKENDLLKENVSKLTEMVAQQNEELEKQARDITKLKKDLGEKETAQSKVLNEEVERFRT